MGKKAKVACISCSHVPHQSERAIKLFLDLLEASNEEKPFTNVIHNGDLFNSDSASVHISDPDEHTLLDEFHAGADLLSRIRQRVNTNCKLTWMLGNHDANILQRNPKRIPKELRQLCNWNNVPVVNREFHRWEQIPYINGREGCKEIGPLIFTHGFKCGANSDDLEAIMMANACGGFAHRLVVRGHTHRPSAGIVQCKRSAGIKLPWHYANVGHTAFEKERPSYMERNSTEHWGRACLIAEADLTNWKEGRAWEAELISLD